MTETKNFLCTRCKKEYPYTPPSAMELFEEPLICAACWEALGQNGGEE